MNEVAVRETWVGSGLQIGYGSGQVGEFGAPGPSAGRIGPGQGRRSPSIILLPAESWQVQRIFVPLFFTIRTEKPAGIMRRTLRYIRQEKMAGREVL